MKKILRYRTLSAGKAAILQCSVKKLPHKLTDSIHIILELQSGMEKIDKIDTSSVYHGLGIKIIN